MSSVGGVGSSSSSQSTKSESWGGGNDDSSSSGAGDSAAVKNAAVSDQSQSNTEKDKSANEPLNTHELAGEPTSTDQIASEPTTTETLAATTDPVNLSPIAGPLGMAARREFNNAPLTQAGAYDAYKGLTADDLAGLGDMRLEQLSRSVDTVNRDIKATLSDALPADVDVTGRAKSPTSTFGKLREPVEGPERSPTAIGDIKDLSGLRASVSPTAPDFADVYQAQNQVADVLGPDLTVKRDYIDQPNSKGYTGRVHSLLEEANGLTHEVQVGTKDLTNFVDAEIRTSTGQKTTLHDVTFYKAEVYGVDLPTSLSDEYSNKLSQITETNRAGSSIADVPEVQGQVTQYIDDVEAALPDRLNSPPVPELSTRAVVGNVTARGLGVLDIAGSAMQANQGYHTLTSGGDTVEGVADLSAGTTGVASSLALASGRIALGTTTGGFVATIDGAKDIYTGIRDGDVEQTAVGVVKSGAGAAMLAGVATANPVLIAGGAIAYGGACYL